MTEKIDQFDGGIYNEMAMNKNNEDLNQPITKQYLGEFTEDVLLPAIGKLIKDEVKPLEDRIGNLEQEIAALNAKLTNYLELSDKRYLELKRRNMIIAKWVKEIGEKTGVEVDLEELEKF